MARPIIVIGDLMTDRTTYVRSRGISKEDSSVVTGRRISSFDGPGGAGNVALNCAKLSDKVDTVLLALGDDTSHSLTDAGVRVLTNQHVGYSVTKERFVTESDNKYLFRCDQEHKPEAGAVDDLWVGADGYGAYLHQKFKEGTGNLPLLALVDYDKGTLTNKAINAIFGTMNGYRDEAQPPVVVDPGRSGNWRRYESHRTIFKVNLDQCVQHYNYHAGPRDELLVPVFDEAAHVANEKFWLDVLGRVRLNLLQTKINYLAVVITLGAGGIVAGFRPECPHHVSVDERYNAVYVPAPHSDLVDVCGAGDTVMAALCVRLAEAESPRSWAAIKDATRMAEKAARVAVSKCGVYAVEREEAWGPRT